MKQAALALAMVCGSAAAHAEQCRSYGNGAVTGTVDREKFYGAPGFGENPKVDSSGFYPVLRLDRPLHFCANGAVEALASDKMQMLFRTGDFDRSMYGKHVRVTGDMVVWETGWHHTPVVLDVKVIRVEP